MWSRFGKGIVLEKLDVKQTCFPPFPGELWYLGKNEGFLLTKQSLLQENLYWLKHINKELAENEWRV